jgi:hypothetical protein
VLPFQLCNAKVLYDPSKNLLTFFLAITDGRFCAKAYTNSCSSSVSFVPVGMAASLRLLSGAWEIYRPVLPKK